jgi:7-cyano-7-deazaguanine synthase in queuosine biosynthesis
MTAFQLRTTKDQTPHPPPAVLLDWLPGGRGTIHRRQSLTTGLKVPPAALDFLRFAGAVFCADKIALRPPTWTRSIALDVPARDPRAWRGAAGDLAEALSFLSGDDWDIDVSRSDEPVVEHEPSIDPVDVVCLFSGGLDSFTGAVDLLAAGRRVCLVAHYDGGQAPKVQQHLARRLAATYGRDRVVFRRLFLRPAPASNLQERPLPGGEHERTTRTRSILFLAAGLAVAAGYGATTPLVIPENGFIGINVPLTRARSGSLSTRTTHPYFMERLLACLSALGITNPVSNPYRTATKGEMLETSGDDATLFRHAPTTLSCAHPEAPRYAKREQGNCGYCFPCLIRRAAMHHVGLDDPDDYAFDALNERDEMEGERGADIRALVRALNTTARPLDVLRNGPVAPHDLDAFAGVYSRGRSEILTWLRAATTESILRRQLPAS